jgi:hypothetical protein
MDPGEAGPHGPWLLTIENGQIKSVEHWVLAPLRWESIDVDIEGIEEPEDARIRVLGCLQSLDTEKVVPSKESPSALGMRITFTGRSKFGTAAVALFDDSSDIYTGQTDTDFFVERVTSLTRPEIDLEEIAGRNDPSGLLAKQLLLLDLPIADPTLKNLLDGTRRKLDKRSKEPHWNGLQPKPLDNESLVDLIRQTGFPLLEKLLAQEKSQA